MRVAITGGTGFLGAHTVERLVAAGHEPICLVRPTSARSHLDRLGVTQVPGHVGDVAAMTRLVADADAVVHAAGLTVGRRREDYDAVNATGTSHLAKAVAARGSPLPFLLVSSLAAKGPTPGEVPLPADGPPRPVSLYGESKRAGEDAARRLAADMPVTIVRPPALYGPGDRAFLPLVRLVRRGLWPSLFPATARASTLYGPDCAELVVALLAADRGARSTREARILEPADGPPHDVDAMREAMREAAGVERLRTLHLPAGLLTGAAHASRFVSRFTGAPTMLNPDKARELRAGNWIADTSTLKGLDWQPRVLLPEGMRATHDWYKQEGWL